MVERFDEGVQVISWIRGVFIMGVDNFVVLRLYEKECYEYGKRLTCVRDLECVSWFVRVGV